MSEADVEDARRHLPPHVFDELYLAKPAPDEGNPFGGPDVIAKCVHPVSTKPAKWWGWDLAKSVDWTVGIGLDEDGHVCDFHRFQLPWEETIERIGRLTNRRPAYVDSTGVGDPIVEKLQKSVGSRFEGYLFSSSSKQKLMEGLAVAIQSDEIGYPAGPIVSELEDFTYEYTAFGVRYTAPDGGTDDCVCALALAQMMRTHARPAVIVSPEALRLSAIKRRA